MSGLLIGGGVAALALGAALFFFYRQGAAAERGRLATHDSEVKDAELRAAQDRPATRDDLIGRLHADDF